MSGDSEKSPAPPESSNQGDACDGSVSLQAATVELKQITLPASMAPTTELKLSELRAAATVSAPSIATIPESSPSKPGAFSINRAPHLAHIGESRVAAIDIESILAGPVAVREAAIRLIAAGFNALAVPLFDDGYTLFPSTAMAERGLPRQHPDLRRRDVMTEFCDIALELKAPLLLTVDFLKAGDCGLGVRYPALRRRRRWAMRNAAGRVLPLGTETQIPMFCPSSRGVLDYYASVCLEAATAYPLSGYILEMPPLLTAAAEAPASDYCYCMECRDRFLNELAGGENPTMLTADADFQRRKSWAFRRQMKQAMLHVRTRVLETRPDCLFYIQGMMRRDSAAAVALDPGTAWYPLAANGAFDGVFVSNYSFCGGDFAGELDQDAALLPSKANLCVSLRSIRADTLAEQIGVLRRHGACGFLAVHAAGLPPEALARLERDMLLWPGFHMESAPRRAVEACLRRLLFVNAGSPPLSAFFRDISRFFASRGEQLGIADIEAIIDNLDSIRQKIRQGALPLDRPPSTVVRLIAQLQKSLFMLCKTQRG